MSDTFVQRQTMRADVTPQFKESHQDKRTDNLIVSQNFASNRHQTVTEKDIADFLNQEMKCNSRSRSPMNVKIALEANRKSNERNNDCNQQKTPASLSELQTHQGISRN